MADSKQKNVALIVILVVLALCAVTACLIAAGILIYNYVKPVQQMVIVEEETQPAAPAVDLQGLWQQNGSMAAGWADRYHFYPSGTFHFFPNEMVCSPQKTQKIGTWVMEGTALTLTTTKQIVTTFEESSGGWCSAIESTEVELASPLVETFTIVDHGTAAGDLYPSISIGDVQFWKFSDDASRYGDEEFPE